MQYANWANNEEIAKKLTKVNTLDGVEHSGVPLMYKGDDLYIGAKDAHNLIIGTTGSGKTQVSILPITKLAIKAGESFLVNDVKGEIYRHVSGFLKREGYNVIAIDFKDAIYGNNWNPLTLAYQFYQKNNIDGAIKELENVGYYLFKKDINESDFWINSAMDYFVGLSLYLFEKADSSEINLESIYVLGNDVDNDTSKFLNSLDKRSSIYFYLNGIMKSPTETRGGILATFNQGLKKYIGTTNLSNMLSNTDFDFEKIAREKTAIFIICGADSDYDNVIPLFVNQVVNCIPEDNRKKFNILLDEFDSLLPIKDFSKLLNCCRSKYVEFTAVVRSFTDLENIYGREQTEVLRMCFANIIYLLSNDFRTLEEISRLCGNKNANEPLVTAEELKIMNYFEAIILMIREMPMKTKLLPDYKINWGEEFDEVSLDERKKNNKVVFTYTK